MRSHVSVFGRFRWPARLLSRMQMLVDARCELWTDPRHQGELADARPQYSMQTAEVLQQFAALHRPEPRHAVEDRFLVSSRTALAVPRDCKSMGFVPYTLNEMQGG